MTEKEILEVINELGIILDSEKISYDAPLTSLGLDSLDIFNLLVELEGKTGKKISDSDLEKVDTIKKLVAYYS